MNQEDLVHKGVNYSLSIFNTEGRNSFWTKEGFLNVNELYKLLLSQGYKGFAKKVEFDAYLKLNIRKFQLIGKLDISRKSYADKFAKAETIIESFTHAISENPLDDDYVVRTKLGNGGVVFYSCGKLTKQELNTLKAAYGVRENIKYYDVRPCLYKNWKNWSDERQQASAWREEDSFTR